MEYISTRGRAAPVSFSEVLLGRLAGDGGLWMPARWPRIGDMGGKSYEEAAVHLLASFVGDCCGIDDLGADVRAAYAPFDVPQIAPLVELERGLYLLELFHGPTLAFKDIAMQLLARLAARELERRNARATILVATSGDTGSAAISAFGGLPRIQIVVLHPRGRISDVQRRQMTTAPHANVHNVALEGTFDDAQALVKSLFSDRDFADAMSLVAVNSINLVRILAQSVYYFTALAKLGGPARFVVPTGNFGDIFAGEAAQRMGAPISGLVAATNANDNLVRALRDGAYAVRGTQATLSPSMDIQIASNFERALYEASGRDSIWLATAMEHFATERTLAIPRLVREALTSRYLARTISDAETLATIGDAFRRWGRLLDPHTAVGVSAALGLVSTTGAATIVVATAHPAKFPETVTHATAVVPPLPARLRHSYVGRERMTVLPPDIGRLRSLVEARTSPHER